MHHTLKLYGRHRLAVLRLYMFGAAWTRLPLLGGLARRLANSYGRNMHRVYLLTPAEAEDLVTVAEGVAVGPCDCRRAFGHCDNPVETEILLGPSRHAFLEVMPHDAREITREEARAILRDCHRRGLIHTIARCRGDFYAICNCCTCCCVPLRLSKEYGIGSALLRHEDVVQEFKEYQSGARGKA
jgi:hypothetical protein